MANWERRDVVVRTTATGHELTAPVFTARGRQERPVAYVQANVHGGELQGNAAILGLEDSPEGLKENVILGKLVPAGTGFISLMKKRRGEEEPAAVDFAVAQTQE